MAKGTTIRMWRRTAFLLALIIAGFAVVVVSLFRLQLVQGEEMQTRAVDQYLKDTSISAQRGTIYDCNMKVLAKSAAVWKVVLEPNYIDDDNRELICNGLSQILGLDKADLIERSKKRTYYDVVKNKVETDVKDQIVAFKEENEITNGIRLIPDYKRYYPYGKFASSVLGFTGSDNQGLAGIEAQYDSELTGVPGRLVTAKNAVGTDMPFDYEQMVDAQNGNILVLTIDEVVQHFLEKYLEEGVANSGTRNRACGIVMNVKTGAILGMAVKGDFDPNDPFTLTDPKEQAAVDALQGEERTKALNEARQKQWRNKCVSDTYYPGSVFKMVTSSMGFEEGIISENTPFSCPGYYVVADRRISCWKSGGHGSETFAQGLCNSCNPVFIQVGEKLGAQTFFEYFEAFGFTQKTGIDLPGESRSIYYDETMGPVELATESFGQNFSITPIQMITAAAAVANGGYLVQPHVVAQVIDDEGNIIRTTDTTVKRQVISNETSRRVSAILQQTATTGTAKNGYIAGYRVAGKTGTSEKIAEWIAQGKQGEKKYIASYCGYAPADDPQVAMLVFFDEPLPQGGQVFGSAIAGPPFAKTMSEILPYLGVEAKYTEEELAKLDTSAPDVLGKSVQEAQNLIQSAELNVKVYGQGDTVLSQVPEPGKSIPKSGQVVLFTDEESAAQTVTVPKLTGLTLAQANSTAANAGINISISGAALTGKNAVSNLQSIPEGSQVPPGTMVTVDFVELDSVE